MKYIISLLLIQLFLITCTKPDKEINENCYHINLDTPQDQVSFFDIFEWVKVVPLEVTNHSLLYRIDKIDYYKGYFYILDKRSKTVFRFDKDGRYFDKLSRVGNGPGEYTDLSDFLINGYTNQLELLSSYGGIYIYDMDFKFVKQLKVSEAGLHTVHHFAVIDRDQRVFYSTYKPFRLKTYSAFQHKMLCKYYKKPVFWARKSILNGPFQFEQENGITYFMQTYDYNLYEITSDTFLVKHTWDFGKHNYSLSELPPDWPIEEYDFYFEELTKKKKVFYFLSNIENSSYAIAQFPYTHKDSLMNIVYEKRSHRYKKFQHFNEGFKFPFYPKFKNDSLIIIPSLFLSLPYYLNDSIKELNSIKKIDFESEDYCLLIYKIRNNIFD